MNSPGKAAAGAFGAGLLAVIGALTTPQGLAFAQWALEELKGFVTLPLFQPVALAIFVGAAVPAWLPHFLPAAWPRAQTLRVTRLLASAVAFAMVALQYPKPIGLQYALFAATGAYALWTVGQNFIYRWFPSIKPPSLIDEDVHCATVRRNALVEGRRTALHEVRAWSDAAGEQATRTAQLVRQALGDA